MVWESTQGSLKFVKSKGNLKVVGLSSSATYSVKNGLKDIFEAKWFKDIVLPTQSHWWLTTAKFEEIAKDHPKQLELLSAVADKAHADRQSQKAKDAASASPASSEDERKRRRDSDDVQPSASKRGSGPGHLLGGSDGPKYVWMLWASQSSVDEQFYGVFDSEEIAEEHKVAFSCCTIKKVMVNGTPFSNPHMLKDVATQKE